MHIAQALALVADRFNVLRPEAALMAQLLTDMPSGMGSLPASVLAAAFEALARGAGPYSRRWLYLEAAVLLGQKGHQPSADDFACAPGVWGAVLNRATQTFRARATEPPPVDGRPDPVKVLADLIDLLGRELLVLVEQALVIRQRRAEAEAIRKLAAVVRAEMRPEPRKKKPRVRKGAGEVARRRRARAEVQAHG